MGDVNGDKGAGSEDATQLKASLETLQGQVKELGGAREALERKLEDADRELLSEEYLQFLESKKGKGRETAPASDEGVDFETMSPKQIIEYVRKEYSIKSGSVSEEIDKKLGSLEDRIGLALAQVDIQLTASKHPDFWEHKDRITKIARENPTISAEKAYRQAKRDAKDELEDKLAVDGAKAERERKALTEKGGASGSSLGQKTFSKDEAADIAWKTAFGTKDKID